MNGLYETILNGILSRKNLMKAVFVLVFLTQTEILAKEIRVCSFCEISTIKKAIEIASDRDVVLLKSGYYSEANLVLNKGLSVVGEPGVVVDGKKKGHVFDVRANNVSIRGIKIVGSGISDTAEYAGIHAEKVKDCVFEKNRLEGDTYSIYLAEVDGCRISGNEAIGDAKNEVSGGNGIHLWSSKNVRIEGNRTEKHRDGIYLEFSSNLKIENNFSARNIRYGMHFMFSSDNDFRGNEFTENSAGVAVMYSKNILVENNKFLNNWGDSSYGILLKEISDSVFVKNEFSKNTVAIFSDGCNRNYFTHNRIFENGWGIRVLGNSDSNIFARNDFKGNVFDVSTNTKRTTNVFFENFWESYKGYDLNRDGFGDVPHKPVHFFGYWVAVYPFLMLLYDSPVVLFLQGIERAFPIVTPIDFEDLKPSIRENL